MLALTDRMILGGHGELDRIVKEIEQVLEVVYPFKEERILFSCRKEWNNDKVCNSVSAWLIAVADFFVRKSVPYLFLH